MHAPGCNTVMTLPYSYYIYHVYFYYDIGCSGCASGLSRGHGCLRVYITIITICLVLAPVLPGTECYLKVLTTKQWQRGRFLQFYLSTFTNLYLLIFISSTTTLIMTIIIIRVITESFKRVCIHSSSIFSVGWPKPQAPTTMLLVHDD